ncbi:MAG: hypothetical protein ACQEQZ_02960 [Pseudomonadota bacterium]
MSRNQWVLLIIIAVIGLFFAPEIFSSIGYAIGSVIEFALSVVVALATIGLVFFLLMTIFGSVGIGLIGAFVAMIFTGIGMFWPLLLCVVILYVVFRNSRKTV